MSEKSVKDILQGIANEGISSTEVDLWPRVKEGFAEKRLGHRKYLSWATIRVAPPLLIVVVLLIISLILIGPERALAALRGLLGYTPGIGLVDEAGGLRVLAAPVTLERDGITVTVEQALLDSEQSVIIYQADGIPADAYPRSEDAPFCHQLPQLRLSDGSAIQLVVAVGGGGWGSGYELRLAYLSVPPEMSEVVFFIPCLSDTSPGEAPENWELVLRFVPAPQDVNIIPVFVKVLALTEATASSYEAQEMGLYLDRVIELEDSYILAGTFRQGGELPGSMVMGISAWPEVTDANGRPLPFEIPSDLDLSSDETGVIPWANQIPKGFTAPITLTLEAVDVEFPVEITFQFDTGADPEVGQEWALNQEFSIAGHTVRLLSAVRTENGYEFRSESDPSVLIVSFREPQYEPVSGSGEGYLGEFITGFEYSPPVPTGLLTYQINRLVAQHPGPWTLTWAPPVGDEPEATHAVP